MDSALNNFFNSALLYVGTKEKRSVIIELLKKDKVIQVGVLHHFINKYPKDYPSGIKKLLEIDPSLEKNVEFAYEVLKHDVKLLSSFPKIKIHPKIKLVQLASHPEKYKSYKDWQNEKKALIAIKFNPIVYRYLSDNLKENKNIIMEVLNTTVLHPQKKEDKLYGLFFDLPQKIQDNKLFIITAVKNLPSLFKSLPEKHQQDSDIIVEALTKGFYEKDRDSFYDLQNIIPYIPKDFYTNLSNIKWIMKGFENNTEQACFYTDCAMLIFCTFMREGSKVHPRLKDFFEKANIKNRFEKMLAKHQFKLYSDDLVPTGIEPEANNFFIEVFPNLTLNFERFILNNKLQNNLSIPTKIDKNKGKI